MPENQRNSEKIQPKVGDVYSRKFAEIREEEYWVIRVADAKGSSFSMSRLNPQINDKSGYTGFEHVLQAPISYIEEVMKPVSEEALRHLEDWNTIWNLVLHEERVAKKQQELAQSLASRKGPVYVGDELADAALESLAVQRGKDPDHYRQ